MSEPGNSRRGANHVPDNASRGVGTVMHSDTDTATREQKSGTGANAIDETIDGNLADLTRSELTDDAIGEAIDRAIERYFSDCRGRIPEFVDRHYRYPGAWQTNRRAFGWDLLRSPLNLLWAPFYVVSALLRLVLEKTGHPRLAAALGRLPPGMKTEVQRYVAGNIYTELLECSATSNYSGGMQTAISEEIERAARSTQASASISTSESEAEQLHRQRLDELNGQLAVLNRDAIEQISVARTASGDIANSTLALLIGAMWFNKFVAGGLALGVLFAAWIARQLAIRDFWLGDNAGGWFYGLFPPAPSLTLVLFSVLAIVSVLSLLCAFWGLLTDPVQAATGLHASRLYKLVDKLEEDLKARTQGSFRPRDQYLARVLEVIDAIRSPFM